MGIQQQRRLVGAIEGGGTKFVCAIGDAPTHLLERVLVPTTDPRTTLAQCLDFFADASTRHGPIAALGIACFGPLQLRLDAADYGCLLPTPKPGWSGANIVAPFRKTLGVPVVLETDVGAAALGELRCGAGLGHGSLCYVTVGTGVGGAIAPEVPGTRLMHAEMGHLLVRRAEQDRDFAGICPFHGDCLEGLASGPAIRARWGSELSALPPDHPGREIIADYLGQLVAAIALLHAPEMVVLGGGVMSDVSLLPSIRTATRERLAGYLPQLCDPAQLEGFLRAPALGSNSAITGAVLLAASMLIEE